MTHPALMGVILASYVATVALMIISAVRTLIHPASKHFRVISVITWPIRFFFHLVWGWLDRLGEEQFEIWEDQFIYINDISDFLSSLEIWKAVFGFDRFVIAFDKLKYFVDTAIFEIPFISLFFL